MEYAFILLLVAAIAVGVTSAVARTWSLHSRLYSAEDRINVLEGNLSREVKIRAATERWKKPAQDELAVMEALKQPPAAKDRKPWWKNPGLPKRSYAP